MSEYTAEQVAREADLQEDHVADMLRDYAALLRERESAKESDDELPGMWSVADFIGGDPDERSYAERESVQKLVTDEIVEHVQYSIDNHPDNRTYAEQVSAASVRAALEAVAPMLASARVPDGDVDFTSDEVDEAMEMLRKYRSSIPTECLDQMERVLLAAAPKPKTEEN